MPAFVLCPHCLFPSVVRPRCRGKGQLCRQCGHGYVVSRKENRIQRLEARSHAQLIELSSARHNRVPRRPKVWNFDN